MRSNTNERHFEKYQRAYMPLGDLFLDFPDSGKPIAMMEQK